MHLEKPIFLLTPTLSKSKEGEYEVFQDANKIAMKS